MKPQRQARGGGGGPGHEGPGGHALGRVDFIEIILKDHYSVLRWKMSLMGLKCKRRMTFKSRGPVRGLF